jgi:hypothetical protein
MWISVLELLSRFGLGKEEGIVRVSWGYIWVEVAKYAARRGGGGGLMVRAIC